MRKEDREVIIWEGNKFHAVQITEHATTNVVLSNIKTKLKDFYTPESKALFLNTLQKKINIYLNKKDTKKSNLINSKTGYKSNGQIKYIESRIRKHKNLLFYLQQEIDTLPLFDISQHLDKVLAKAKTENRKFLEKRNKVFICYSRSDSAYKDEIKKYFKPFLKEFTVWCDDDINASEVWNDKIEQAISETKVAIFLVSADFLASDFVMDKEVPAILKAVEKGHTFPLFIILKPCLFDFHPDLNKYQTVNPPTQEVSRMDENEKAALFVNLVRLTMEILDYGKE